ncbi:MAG: tRNA lysidine(34) synthetase TilS, partial [Anaerolineae bacterium]
MTDTTHNAADLLGEVASGAAAHDFFRPGDVVVVAVSGGADSVALLDLLDRHRLHVGYDLVVAHLDHGLRETSVDDAAFVAEMASERGLTADLGAADVSALAAAGGWSPEDAGRRARYSFLAAAAERAGAGVVATAHHGDDQAETVLLNIIRGTGLDGLAGMEVCSPWPLTEADLGAMPRLLDSHAVPTGDLRPRLVRPLLALRRSQIAAYVAARGLAYREDP